MLIEYVGPQATEMIPFRGVDYRFVPVAEYRNACVLDVVNAEAIAHILKQTGLSGDPWYRRYPLDALRDPEFLRYIDSNPEAARFRLTQIDAGDVQVDLEQLEWQLIQTEPIQLRIYAETRGIELAEYAQKPLMVQGILEHYRKILAGKKAADEALALAGEPQEVPTAEPAEQALKPKRTRKARGLQRPRGRPRKNSPSTAPTSGLAVAIG